MGDDLSTVPKMPPLTSRLLAMVLALSALYVLTAMPVSDDVNHALSALESVPEEPPGSVANLQAELQADDDFGKLKRRRRRRRRRRKAKKAKKAQKLVDWNKHLDRNGWKQMPVERLDCPLLIKHRGIFGNKATHCTNVFCKRNKTMKKDLGCFKRTDYAKKRRRANKTKGKHVQKREAAWACETHKRRRNGCRWYDKSQECVGSAYADWDCGRYWRRTKRGKKLIHTRCGGKGCRGYVYRNVSE